MKYRIFITAASSYFIGCAFLYAQGFWSVFGVRVLEFAGLNELIRFAIHGLVALLLSLALALILSVLTSAYFHALEQEDWRLRWHKNVRRGSLSWMEIGRLLTSNLFLTALVLTAIFVEIPDKWIYVASLLLLVALLFPSRIIPIYKMYFENVMPPVVFSPLFAVLISIPVYVYGTGLNQAEQLKRGKVERYILAFNDGSGESWTYIGRLGSQYFFYQPEKSELLIKQDEEELRMRRMVP